MEAVSFFISVGKFYKAEDQIRNVTVFTFNVAVGSNFFKINSYKR